MAQPERIKISRAPDRSVAEFFKLLATQYNVPEAHINAYGGAQIGAVQIQQEPTGDFGVLLELDSELISTMQLRIAGLTIGYYRSGYPAPDEERSPIYDEITLAYNAQQGDVSNEDKLRIVALVNSKLTSFQSGRHAGAVLPKEFGDLAAIHNTTLERLETLGEDFIRQTSDYKLELDRRQAEKTEELEAEFGERRQKLDAESDEKQNRIDKEREQLQARQKEIDDRDNTHVRRELRMSILEEIKERSAKFALTKGTQRLRWPIHVACLIVFGIAVGFSYVYSTQLFAYLQGESSTTVNVVLLTLKSLGFTVLAATTGVFYVRWLNRWFSQHADAEFRLKQFQLDVDRASWVVETVLEMKADKEVMPTPLLQSLTKNLFEYEQSGSTEERHPADELASALLGTASDIRVKAGDAAEITFTGKDLRKKMKQKKSD